jgi:hypothetical protein
MAEITNPINSVINKTMSNIELHNIIIKYQDKINFLGCLRDVIESVECPTHPEDPVFHFPCRSCGALLANADVISRLAKKENIKRLKDIDNCKVN